MQYLDQIMTNMDLDYHKDRIEKYVCHRLEWNTLYRYLLSNLSPFPNFYAQVTVQEFKWGIDEEFSVGSGPSVLNGH